MTNETYNRFVERYQSGELPWADELPPPEVIDLVPTLSPGRALDLGCGYGRTAIYLALHGWTADGVDFVEQAVEEAVRRAAAAGVADQTKFYAGSASTPQANDTSYDLAIDIGCMHSFSDELLIEYRDSLKRVLRSGATYLLFVHLRNESPEGRPHGIAKGHVETLFADGFSLDRVEHGTTQVEDRPPWESAWYWFKRN